MRKENRILLLLLMIGCASRITAQPVWIPETQLTNLPNYDLLKSEHCIVLALGNIHNDASQALFESHCLDKLIRLHGYKAATSGTHDVSVVFINVQPIAQDDQRPAPHSFPVITIGAADALLANGLGNFYDPYKTALLVITPDHLAYPLHGDHADDLYKEIKSYQSKIKPSLQADVRLIRVQQSLLNQDNSVAVSFQNYSLQPLQKVTLFAYKGNALLDSMTWTGHLASLDAVTVPFSFPNEKNGAVEIKLVADTDRDPSNNYTHLLNGYKAETSIGDETVYKIDFKHFQPGEPDTLLITEVDNRMDLAVMELNYAHAPATEYETIALEFIYTEDGIHWKPLAQLTAATLNTAPESVYDDMPRKKDWKQLRCLLPIRKNSGSFKIAVAYIADLANPVYLKDIHFQSQSFTLAPVIRR